MTDTSPRQQTNCSTNTQNRYSDRMLTDRPDRVRSCRTCEREAQPSKQTVCRRHCRETPENRTIIARYHGPASHTLVNACAHETSFWTPMCVSHVTLAFTRIFIPNGPLKLQKTPHKTPCRGTTLGRRAWSAYSSFNSLLFRSPSSPKRYVTQVHRPAHDRPGGNHVQQHCRATRRDPSIDGASGRGPIPRTRCPYKDCIHSMSLDSPVRDTTEDQAAIVGAAAVAAAETMDDAE